MNQDFSELIEYLDQKFTTIDAKLDVKADKADVDGLKIDISGLKVGIADLKESKADKADIVNLLGAIDVYAAKADAYFQEMVMMSHNMDRHEKWIKQLADKLGVKLEY